LTAVDRILAIGARRARLTGLDKGSAGGLRSALSEGAPAEDSSYIDESGARVFRLEIVGDPEATRKRRPRSE
jgi:hypothetical protein